MKLTPCSKLNPLATAKKPNNRLKDFHIKTGFPIPEGTTTSGTLVTTDKSKENLRKHFWKIQENFGRKRKLWNHYVIVGLRFTLHKVQTILFAKFNLLELLVGKAVWSKFVYCQASYYLLQRKSYSIVDIKIRQNCKDMKHLKNQNRETKKNCF